MILFKHVCHLNLIDTYVLVSLSEIEQFFSTLENARFFSFQQEYEYFSCEIFAGVGFGLI